MFLKIITFFCKFLSVLVNTWSLIMLKFTYGLFNSKRDRRNPNPCTDASTHPLTNPRTHPLTAPRTHPLTNPRTYPRTDPRTHPLTNPRARIHSLTHARTDPRTDPRTYPSTDLRKHPRTVHSRIHALTHANVKALTHASIHALTHASILAPQPVAEVQQYLHVQVSSISCRVVSSIIAFLGKSLHSNSKRLVDGGGGTRA